MKQSNGMRPCVPVVVSTCGLSEWTLNFQTVAPEQSVSTNAAIAARGRLCKRHQNAFHRYLPKPTPGTKKSRKSCHSVPIKETFCGKIVWEGVVHVFSLSGHPTAKRAYAWSSPIKGSDKRRAVVRRSHTSRIWCAKEAVKANAAQT